MVLISPGLFAISGSTSDTLPFNPKDDLGLYCNESDKTTSQFTLTDWTPNNDPKQGWVGQATIKLERPSLTSSVTCGKFIPDDLPGTLTVYKSGNGYAAEFYAPGSCDATIPITIKYVTIAMIDFSNTTYPACTLDNVKYTRIGQVPH